MLTRLTLSPIIHWKGQWVEGTAYKKDAVVANNGSTFIASVANPATEPTVEYDADNNTYTVSQGWELVAYGSTVELAGTVAEHRADQVRDEEVLAEHIARIYEEIKGLVSAVDNLGDARAHSLSVDSMLQICGSKLILSGEGAPASTPDFIGQVYEDTSNGIHYVALGTSSASNWIAIANKALTDALSANKVDKIEGKGLSANDYTDEEKAKNSTNESNISSLSSSKVDKVEGKALSENDYSDAEKALNASNKARLDIVEVVIAEHLASIRQELIGFAAVMDNFGDVRARSLSVDSMLQICGSKLILSGEGAPDFIPDFIGQEYCDLTNKKSYKAFGNTSVSHWTALN